jgi:hypothetical protein
VALTWTGLNSGRGGVARLYLNGRLEGSARDIREPFTWNIAQSTIRIGINYVGLWDDLSIFERALNDGEVQYLYWLKRGVRSLYR